LKIVPNGTMCQNGHELLQWDQTGSVGPVGPAGPAGPSAAFSVQSRTEVDLPPTFTPILELAVPAGNYVVTAGVVVHNFSAPRETLAVLCTIGTPTESSLTYSARIDAFNSATAQGASSATIPLSVVTHLDSPGTVTLQCETNNLSRQMAFASSRHLTAVLVGSATRSEM